jgi:uncharacterized protein (DUF1697 family)
MTKYVALLRGIGPNNPNMRGAKLKSVIEDLGFSNVQTVISSGNVLFESDSKDIPEMESIIERAWPIKLGFTSTTIIRSQDQLQALSSQEPYKDSLHTKESYLLVTFFKNRPADTPTNFYNNMGVNALCNIIDTTILRMPDFMPKLEKQFGKTITSRTWNTVQRILKKMG